MIFTLLINLLYAFFYVLLYPITMLIWIIPNGVITGIATIWEQLQFLSPIFDIDFALLLITSSISYIIYAWIFKLFAWILSLIRGSGVSPF